MICYNKGEVEKRFAVTRRKWKVICYNKGEVEKRFALTNQTWKND